MEARLDHSRFLNQGVFPLPERHVGQTETTSCNQHSLLKNPSLSQQEA